MSPRAPFTASGVLCKIYRSWKMMMLSVLMAPCIKAALMHTPLTSAYIREVLSPHACLLPSVKHFDSTLSMPTGQGHADFV